MKKTLCVWALLAVVALPAACSVKIFEDIGSDPHIPTLEITGLEHFVEPPPEVPTAAGADASRRGRAISWDSGGFTVARGKLFLIAMSYSDAGGDIVKFHFRDRDGATESDLIPIDQTYFPGTSGTLTGPVNGLEITGLNGLHRLELWAEDSHGSRSEKVEFVITLAL